MSDEKMTKKEAGRFLVYVDDNFHFMDEDERYLLGNYDTFEEAEAISKRIVDEHLESNYKPGMKAEDLYDSYTSFGEDPFIMGPDSRVTYVDPATGETNWKPRFSAWDYAKDRCREICEENDKKEEPGR